MSAAHPVDFRRSLVVAVVAVLASGALLIGAPAIRTPILHAILDTSIFLTSAMLALLLGDIGGRTREAPWRLLAVTFAIVSLLELVHTVAVVQQSIRALQFDTRVVELLNGSWAPSTYLLPLGLSAIALSAEIRRWNAWFFAGALAAAGIVLLVLFRQLHNASPPLFLGVTRPTFVFVPLLWAAVGSLYRRRENTDMGRAIACASILLVPTFAVMCWSTGPYSAPAAIGHVGKLAADLFLLFAVMQIAAEDIARRVRAERALRDLNETLEQRVADRTASLTIEMRSRAAAEQRTGTQLARLNLLHDITAAIGERADLERIFDIVVGKVADRLSVAYACIGVYEEAAGVLRIGNVATDNGRARHDASLRAGATIAADIPGIAAPMRGEPVYEPDTTRAASAFAQRLAAAGLGAAVFAPLMVEGRFFGLLIAARETPDSFGSGDCQFLHRLSVHVSLAADQANLYATLQRAYDDLRQSQQTVLQQERLRVLGQMASGVAHDISNAITPLYLTTQRYRESIPTLTPGMRAYLDQVKRTLDGVAGTVSRIRRFYREGDDDGPPKPVDLGELAQQTIDLTRARWRDMALQQGVSVRLTTKFLPELPPAAGYESEIREALTNLLFNAVDAMPRGGELTVSTGRREDRLFVEVADTGVGMTEEVRQRCLEPFFTTKGADGTGLGLAMVYGTMRRHGGEIEIDSRDGEGTTVRLLFAQADAATVPATEAPRIDVPPMRILLIDDDPHILDSMRMFLALDGHRVVTADTGTQGIAQFHAARAGGESFDVVFTDLGMPAMDGRAAAAEIKAASPGTAVILLTGWSTRMGDETVAADIDFTLPKPPEPDALKSVLGRCASLLTGHV